MEADHRHELQQNDLAEFLKNLGQWWSKNGLKTLLIVFIAVAAMFLYRLHRTGAERAHDEAWRDLSRATSADQYRGVARSYENPAIQALAYLRAGDMTLLKTMMPDEPAAEDGEDDPSQDAATPDQTREEMLDSAEADYNAVLGNPEAHKLIKLNATLGLASVAESRMLGDEARKVYQQIQDQAGAGYEHIAMIASKRAAALDRAATPVVFAPEDPVEPKTEDGAGDDVTPIDLGDAIDLLPAPVDGQ